MNERNQLIVLNIATTTKKIDNEHLVFCQELNTQSDLRFEHILNGSLAEKIDALKQAKYNEDRRKKDIETL